MPDDIKVFDHRTKMLDATKMTRFPRMQFVRPAILVSDVVFEPTVPSVTVPPVITPPITDNLLYHEITKLNNLTDYGILKLFQKTNIDNTFLVVPEKYGIMLNDDYKPACHLEELLFIDGDTTKGISSASIHLGIAPQITEIQFQLLKDALQKICGNSNPITIEFPRGNDALQAKNPNSDTQVFGNIQLISMGKYLQGIGNYYSLVLKSLNLTSITSTIKILQSTNTGIPFPITVNEDADCFSTVILDLKTNNIFGKAILYKKNNLGFEVTNNTGYLINIKSILFEGDTEEIDIAEMNLNLAPNEKNRAINWFKFPDKNFALNYSVEYDDKKLIQTGKTIDDELLVKLTLACPAASTLSGGEDFFAKHKINTITISLASKNATIITDEDLNVNPNKIVLSATNRQGMITVNLPLLRYLLKRELNYSIEISFTNEQPIKLITNQKPFNLFEGAFIMLDNNLLQL